MKKLFIGIWIATLASGVAHGDIFRFSEFNGESSAAGQAEWLLLDDDRDPTADPFPWGISAVCSGNGSYELSVALHGIVSRQPQRVAVTYAIGDAEPVATRGFALDSILTGFSESLMADLAEATALGQKIVLGVTGESAMWSTEFEGYDPDPDKVEFVTNGCR